MLLIPVVVAVLLAASMATALSATSHSVVASSLSRASLGPARSAPPSSGAPAGSAGSLPAVAPAAAHHDPNAMVTLPAPATANQLAAINALKGVDAVEVVDVGTVGFEGAPAHTIGVDPGTFRNFTPTVTAASDRLWQYVAAGTLASSFDMSRDRKLTLGAQVAVTPAGSKTSNQQFLGAFMSVGLPGVDMVVSSQVSAPLGLTRGAGVILSAPSADVYTLQTALQAIAPGASVALMRPGQALGSAPKTGGGSTVTATAAQLSTAITAAISRIGKPYIWGATGPNGFDCSGLVGWSFAAAGINLPRTAAEQALAGPAVPLSRIQPGDLLFWSFDPADPGFIDHDAMYVGNGQVIEAPQTGSVVHVIALQTSHLVGAIRVDPAVAARTGSPWHR